MSRVLARFVIPTFVALAALVAACSGGSDEPDPTATTGSSGATGSTGTTSASGSSGSQGASAISSYDEVQNAVIQIVAQGTFRDPEVGLAYGSGAGSGFIISPDGLAVTNNHVVAGAATLEVFIGGNTSKSYNATIVGVSECNDLAVIDIRESEPLAYLAWYDDEIVPGVDVYTAGFPLGDPQFTMTRGIVSKSRANGDITGSSSIDHTIEHDANIQPGNSGGPLVSSDGKIVGVNYAATNYLNTTQFFAIASELAQPVVEQLKEGDFESLGVNGWAVYDEALGISGIWVAGVAAGSPAANAKILPGDIITYLNGLPMGLDGTMADYCDVLRTAGEGKPMTVEVLRYDNGQVLRGEINSTNALEVVSIAAAIEEETDVDTDSGSAGGYSGYQSITDDTDTLIVDVPLEWADTSGLPCNIDGVDIPCVSAAPNLDSFFDTFSTSGLIFALFGPQSNVEDLLERYSPTHCTYYGTYEYSDPVFTGLYDIWENCGTTGAYLVVLSAVPADGAYTALLQVVIEADADWDALDEAFATFNVLQ